TYFPPEDRYGRPGFPRVLEAIAGAYRRRRAELEELAGRVVEALAEVEAPREPAAPWRAAGESPLHRAADRLARSFDSRHGGFGTQPKFPSTTALALLWRSGLEAGPGAPGDQGTGDGSGAAPGRDHIDRV